MCHVLISTLNPNKTRRCERNECKSHSSMREITSRLPDNVGHLYPGRDRRSWSYYLSNLYINGHEKFSNSINFHIHILYVCTIQFVSLDTSSLSLLNLTLSEPPSLHQFQTTRFLPGFHTPAPFPPAHALLEPMRLRRRHHDIMTSKPTPLSINPATATTHAGCCLHLSPLPPPPLSSTKMEDEDGHIITIIHRYNMVSIHFESPPAQLDSAQLSSIQRLVSGYLQLVYIYTYLTCPESTRVSRQAATKQTRILIPCPFRFRAPLDSLGTIYLSRRICKV